MLVTSIPHAESARIAASRPEPGPLTITSTDFKPCTKAALAAVSAAICAAYGVDFLEPLNPRPPALAQDSALPCASVKVTIVLLKEDWICACPRSTFFFTRFFVTFPVFKTCNLIRTTRYFLFPVHLSRELHLSKLYDAYYFFLFATVLRGPLRVLALVLVF